MKTSQILPPIIVALSLNACGGGGSSDKPPGVVTPDEKVTLSNTGSITAKFVPGTNSKALFWSIPNQSLLQAPFVQTDDGAVTTLNDYALSGTPSATLDISGDETYAMGRWALGTATLGAQTYSVSAINDAYHYVVFNPVSVAPVSGTFVCDAGKFTRPNQVRGPYRPRVELFGWTIGTASATASTAGVQVSMNLQTTAFGSTNAWRVNTLVAHGSTMSLTRQDGASDGGLDSVWVTLGAGRSGELLLVMGYTVTLQSDTFQGVALFKCR